MGVDLVLGRDPTGAEDFVIEVNPRLTTSYVGLRAAAKTNLAEAMLRVAEGDTTPVEFLTRVAGIRRGRQCKLCNMKSSCMTWLALDIGGANLKAVDGLGWARSVPFALWREPECLTSALDELVRAAPATGRFAVTMTGELCDSFAHEGGRSAAYTECGRSGRGQPRDHGVSRRRPPGVD